MPAAANSVVTSPIMPEIIALPYLILNRVYVYVISSTTKVLSQKATSFQKHSGYQTITYL